MMAGASLSAQDCGMVKVGTWSGYTISDKQAFRSQLNNTANYGQNGTYNKVKGFTFTDITSTLSTLSVAQLVAQYDIINTGYSNMSTADAQKIKQYVDAGGVALIFLDAGNKVGSNLHQAFGGTGTVGDDTVSPSYATSTTNAINNGLWGDARNVSLKGYATSGLVNITQLPAGAIQLANNGTKARVWITGTNERAIFSWDEGIFDPLDGSTTVSGTDINTSQEKFIHNLMVYALDKLKARTYTPTPTASAGGSTAICTGNSVALTSSSATGNQWYKDGTIISGATGQTYSANTVGTYTVVVTSNGCPSSPSSGIVVTVNPVPAVPTVNTTAASCSAEGTATISNYNSAYTYIFSPAGPTVGAGGVISGMTAGTNYTVTAESGTCTSAASTSFSIAAMLPTPATPMVNIIGGVATVNNYNSAYTYTFSPSGPNVGAGGVISGMTAGTSYTLTAQSGTCISAASSPFMMNMATCIPDVFLTQDANTSLYVVNTSTNPFTYTPKGAPAGFGYNATAYNPKDGFLYAIKNDPTVANILLRIDPSTGTVTELGNVAGLTNSRYLSGEIDDNGNYYVLPTPNSTYNTRLHKINIATLTATFVNLNRIINTFDFAYNINDGLLYGVHTLDISQPKSGLLYSLNPLTGVVNFIGVVPYNEGNNIFGAMYGAAGEIYGAKNVGGLYKFNTITGEKTLISSSPFSNVENDGAHCVTSAFNFPVDLYTTKTDGKIKYIPGTSNVYTVVVGNNGPFGVQGAIVTDAVPSGIPAANMSYTAGVLGGGTTTVSGTNTGAINDIVNLPVGGTVTYTVTVNIPPYYTGDLINKISIAPPPGTVDINTTNNTAIDIDTTDVCLKPGDFSVAGTPTKFGITVQQKQSNWPENIPNGFIALESKTKGFVITRVQNQNAITDPKEGMLIYDIDAACVKLYNGTVWQCIQRSCNN